MIFHSVNSGHDQSYATYHESNLSLRTEVRTLNGFSAHAGRSALIAFGAHCRGRHKRALLVHGEDKSLEALRSGLHDEGVKNIAVMEEGVSIEV